MSSTIDTTTRRVPPLGGFNLTVLGIEVRRMLRNRRTIIFTLIFPAALFFAIGSGTGWQEKVGHGNVAAYVMVSMALYGAALTAASAGAMVATERALGWSRQLRLTPLNPAVYIGMKALIALILGAVAISVVNVVAILQDRAAMAAASSSRCCWASSAPLWPATSGRPWDSIRKVSRLASSCRCSARSRCSSCIARRHGVSLPDISRPTPGSVLDPGTHLH